MLTAWLCFDKPGSLDLRMKTRDEHLAWLEKNVTTFKFAGPILGDDGVTPQGSMIIADFESLAHSREMQTQDPYHKAGLFERVVVQPTKQVFPKA